MSKRQIDRTKKSNIKCEHCKHYCRMYHTEYFPRTWVTAYDACRLTSEPKEYYQRCKQFEWKEEDNGKREN